MALWQWYFYLVPRGEALKQVHALPAQLDLDVYDNISWWGDYPAARLVSLLEGILPKHDPPEAQNSRSWGSYPEDGISLSLDHGQLAEIEIQVDLRSLSFPFLNSIIEIARNQDFLMYVHESGKLLEPILADVLDEIHGSRKMVFVTDPERFFADKDYLECIDRQARAKIEG
jgi:hypothetical protein